MNHRKEGIIVGIIAGVIILGMLIFAVVVELKPEWSKKANKVPVADVSVLVEPDAQIELAEYYKLDMSMYSEDGSNVQSMYVTFLPSQQTFNYWYSNQSMGKGTYTIQGNEVILTLSSGEEMRYILDGEHLFLESNVCAGTVPAEDIFEETFYQKTNDTSVYYYIFRKDGTYTLRQTVDDAENPKDISADGTYSRDGNMINYTVGEFPATPHLIYKDHLIVNYYQEISQEQYQQEMEDIEKALTEGMN